MVCSRSNDYVLCMLKIHYVICFPSQALKMGSIYKHRKLNLLLCRMKQPIHYSSTVTFASVTYTDVSLVEVGAATWAFIEYLSKFCTVDAKVLISFLNRLGFFVLFLLLLLFLHSSLYNFLFFLFPLSLFSKTQTWLNCRGGRAVLI